MIRKLTSLFVFLYFINTTLAQKKYLKNTDEMNFLSKNVTTLFKDNKVSEAFVELKPYWPVSESEIESLESKTIKYIDIIEERFGKPLKIEEIRNESISDFAKRKTFLIQYPISAIRLIFTFFRSTDGWVINAFKWDDSFEEEFKDDKK